MAYRFFSKDISEKISCLQRNNFDFQTDGRLSYEELADKYPRIKSVLKWWCDKKEKNYSISKLLFFKDFLIDNPPDFLISSKCCHGAKKNPSHKYENENDFDLKCLGLRKAEGGVRSTAFKNCFTYNPSAKTQNFRPIWWLTDAEKEYYTAKRNLLRSDCYTVYGFTRTGCAGCPFNSNFEKDLQIIKQYEPKLYKAVINIFGKSYDYTRKYREYKEQKKREAADNGQLSFFDEESKEGGGK